MALDAHAVQCIAAGHKFERSAADRSFGRAVMAGATKFGFPRAHVLWPVEEAELLFTHRRPYTGTISDSLRRPER